ncbi:hypothetical protein CY34DRAFT_70253, partial [Suillus luteus UH-Slu-Lm8-n1]
KVRVRSEHCYGSLKGRFQSLRELRFQIQSQKDLNYANMWTCCCLILHNLIIEIEEELGTKSTNPHFRKESQMQGDRDLDEEEGGGDEGFIGTAGQNFRNTLMGRLLRSRV